MAWNLPVCVLFYGHCHEDTGVFVGASCIYCSDGSRPYTDRTGGQKDHSLWENYSSAHCLSGGEIRLWFCDRSGRAVHILNNVSLFCIDPSCSDPFTGGTSGSAL